MNQLESFSFETATNKVFVKVDVNLLRNYDRNCGWIKRRGKWYSVRSHHILNPNDTVIRASFWKHMITRGHISINLFAFKSSLTKFFVKCNQKPTKTSQLAPFEFIIKRKMVVFINGIILNLLVFLNRLEIHWLRFAFAPHLKQLRWIKSIFKEFSIYKMNSISHYF